MPKVQSISTKDLEVSSSPCVTSFEEQREPQAQESDDQKKIEIYLESLCNDREKELFYQAKNALLESNSSFTGYQELLRKNLENLLEIAREMMENQKDYEFYMELFVEEMNVLKENLEQIQLIANYIFKKTP